VRVFADTFYWIALTDPADTWHGRACEYQGALVTTDEVLTEYLTFFCASPEFVRREVALAVEDILQDPSIEVISQSHASFVAGLQLYKSRPDKGYSLTDCISMQTMRRAELTEVLTNDRHFEREGFRTLFR
jgi:predicted nucleic acid-binding protein